MRAYEIIKAKRDGLVLADEDIRGFIDGFTRGSVADYQMSALCMAVFFRGLSDRELSAWTSAMLHSGEVLDLSEIPGVKVDKHSTGGVGDKVSVCLAPLVAACGVPVPIISGRGLGHTGGTLDKLESIPGFRVDLSIADYRAMVREVGACLIGQTSSLAPADKRLYALRDVTATVDCIPLIASSIMSKKMAEGIDALVLDVKVGSGAFMRTLPEAQRLARTMVGIGATMGRRVSALLTDMNQPLGRTVGNALEVKEAIDVLEGSAPDDLTEITLSLAAEMLLLGKRVTTLEEAAPLLHQALADGSALKKLEQIIERQGGDAKIVADRSRLPAARRVATLDAVADGFVARIDTEAVGLAAVALGAGRDRVDAIVDPSVGFVLHKKLGDAVVRGEPLLDIHYNDLSKLDDVRGRLLKAYQLAPAAPPPQPLILDWLR